MYLKKSKSNTAVTKIVELEVYEFSTFIKVFYAQQDSSIELTPGRINFAVKINSNLIQIVLMLIFKVNLTLTVTINQKKL